MRRCQFCHREVRNSADGMCPYCGRVLAAESEVQWTSVARLSNLAEAGFFSQMLADEGIESQIRQHDDFSALDGSWSSVYVMQVPQADAQRATERIRQELSSGGVEELGTTFKPETVGAAVAWKPVALMLFAGSLAYLAGQNVPRHEGQVPQNDSRASLWDAVRQIETPLVSEPAAGGARFRLSYDRAHAVFLLEEDRDGDGRYDQRRAFHQRSRPVQNLAR
ncbi:MAG: hypothetical protein WDZ59_05545 [Pirellulales bacterium]